VLQGDAYTSNCLVAIISLLGTHQSSHIKSYTMSGSRAIYILTSIVAPVRQILILGAYVRAPGARSVRLKRA